MAGPQRHEDQIRRLKEEPADAATALGRVEEQLRALARSIEGAERGQFENQRAMSKAAAEMNVAAREQARAFAQLGASVASLTKRLERIERFGASDTIKDVLKALHLGLTRVAEKTAQTESQSTAKIAEFAARLESEAEKVEQVRRDAAAQSRSLDERYESLDARIRAVETATPDTNGLTKMLEQRLAQFDERLRYVERAIDQQGAELERARTAVSSIARLEEDLGWLERRMSQPHEHTAPPEHAAPTSAPSTTAPGELSVAPPAEPPQKFEPDTKGETHPSGAPAEASHLESEPDLHEGGSGAASPEPADILLLDEEASEPAQELDPEDRLSIKLPSGLETEDGPEGAPPMPETPRETPTAEAFLASVRRSAQSAAHADEKGARDSGGFAWNVRHEASARPQTRYGLIGLGALVVVLLVVAVVLFTRPGMMGRVFKTPPVAARLAHPPTRAAARAFTMRPGAQHEPAKSAPSLQSIPPANSSNSAEETSAASQPAANTSSQPSSLGALDRLSALANAGNPKAEMIVGLKYVDGDGVQVDEAEAAKWLERAAESGEAIAQYRLGTLYARGRGVPADPALALHWYQLAASAGNRKAMHNLAVAYAQGSGTPKDFAEAARWFSKAANLGYADSQFNLAVLYERGLGVPQSLIDAYKWYAIAAVNGDKESKARLDVLTSQLGADARDAAQHAADQFKPASFDPAVNIPPQMSEIVR